MRAVWVDADGSEHEGGGDFQSEREDVYEGGGGCAAGVGGEVDVGECFETDGREDVVGYVSCHLDKYDFVLQHIGSFTRVSTSLPIY